MEGRRRLCKMSCVDDNDNDGKSVGLDDLEVSELVDFDSPPLPKKNNAAGVERSHNRSEIRDILDELSSKFDVLSIEKRPVAAKPGRTFESCSPVVIDDDSLEDKNVDYASADSSFSVQQDTCETSSDASKSGIEHVEDDLDDSVEVLDHFDSQNDDSITLNGPHSTFKLKGKIAKMLYPHQRDGLKWLWCLHCQGKGGILGDDMGLGKTMQVIDDRLATLLQYF